MIATRCWDLCVFIISRNTETPRAEEQKHQLRPSSEQNFTQNLQSGSISTHVSSLSRLLSCRRLTNRRSGPRVYIDPRRPQHRKWPHFPSSSWAPIIMQICLSCFHKIIYNGCLKLLINNCVGFRSISPSQVWCSHWAHSLGLKFEVFLRICWESQWDECFPLKTG